MEEGTALVFKNAAGGKGEMVVDAGEGGEIGGAAEAAHFGVGYGVADAVEARHEGRAGTHGAGFFGDVEGAAFEAPAAEVAGGLGEGEHFGVGGGVLVALDGVVGGGDDFAGAHDDAADGDFAGPPGVDSLIVSEAHEERVVAHELRRVPFRERALGGGGCGGRHLGGGAEESLD